MSAEPFNVGTWPTVPPTEGWTVADVDALPDRNGVRYELVDGVPHMMTPPRVRHQNVLRRLANALESTIPDDLLVVEGVELDPVHVVAYRLPPDGMYVEVGQAYPGGTLKLDEPFAIRIEPTALVR